MGILHNTFRVAWSGTVALILVVVAFRGARIRNEDGQIDLSQQQQGLLSYNNSSSQRRQQRLLRNVHIKWLKKAGMMAAQKDSAGLQATPRIVGGTEAVKGVYPAFGFSAGRKLCGATLIYYDIMLTAAHCAGAFLNGTVLGGLRIDGSDGRFVGVASEFPHPNYDAKTDENDIMLIQLKESIEDIPLQQINSGTSSPADGEDVTVIGVGYTSENGTFADTLQQVQVNVVSFEDCNAYFNRITADMLCAGSPDGKDSCSGDSGGPLLTQSGIQVGIVSFGQGCARPKVVAAVYSRVSYFDTWISDNICRLSSNPPGTCNPVETPAPTLASSATAVAAPSQVPVTASTSKAPAPVASPPDSTTAAPAVLDSSPPPGGSTPSAPTAAPVDAPTTSPEINTSAPTGKPTGSPVVATGSPVASAASATPTKSPVDVTTSPGTSAPNSNLLLTSSPTRDPLAPVAAPIASTTSPAKATPAPAVQTDAGSTAAPEVFRFMLPTKIPSGGIATAAPVKAPVTPPTGTTATPTVFRFVLPTKMPFDAIETAAPIIKPQPVPTAPISPTAQTPGFDVPSLVVPLAPSAYGPAMEPVSTVRPPAPVVSPASHGPKPVFHPTVTGQLFSPPTLPTDASIMQWLRQPSPSMKMPDPPTMPTNESIIQWLLQSRPSPPASMSSLFGSSSSNIFQRRSRSGTSTEKGGSAVTGRKQSGMKKTRFHHG